MSGVMKQIYVKNTTTSSSSSSSTTHKIIFYKESERSHIKSTAVALALVVVKHEY